MAYEILESVLDFGEFSDLSPHPTPSGQVSAPKDMLEHGLIANNSEPSETEVQKPLNTAGKKTLKGKGKTKLSKHAHISPNATSVSRPLQGVAEQASMSASTQPWQELNNSITQAMKAGFEQFTTEFLEAAHKGYDKECKRSSSSTNVPETKAKRLKSVVVVPDSVTNSESDDTETELKRLLSEGEQNCSSNDDLLGDIQQEYEADDKVGPKVKDKLATLTDKILMTKLSDEKLAEKQKAYCRPQNCTKLMKTKVNPEIWALLKPGTRSRDLKFLRVQKLLVSAFVPLLQLTEKLLAKQSVKDEVKLATDTITLMANANIELNLRRRELMRPDLNTQYQRLCAPSVPITQLLFGDDLTKAVHDIKTTNKVGNKLGRQTEGRSRSFGYRHYSGRTMASKKSTCTTSRIHTKGVNRQEATRAGDEDTGGAKAQ
ncbi:uncharacterized protein LOC119725881 [Patiria miniata]|uniref:Uncharacterized protein n=1 Tax=Patiria miniata TaxID=46514 RepID=A0A913ZQJ8_PATMI|nr:uncharacterized protein LOC119725881 [Patiria miniata]